MAEDDRFSKKVGWGYKKVYRLGCSATDPMAAARVAVRAFCKATREGSELPGLRDCVDALRQAISVFTAGGGEDSSRNLLDVLLGAVEVNHSVASTPLLQEAAASSLEVAMASGINSANIDEAFYEILAERLLDFQCFAPTREGMIEKSGRSLAEQTMWERNLLDISRPFLVKALKVAEKRSDGRILKCPELPQKIQTYNTLEGLRIPLEILPEK